MQKIMITLQKKNVPSKKVVEIGEFKSERGNGKNFFLKKKKGKKEKEKDNIQEKIGVYEFAFDCYQITVLY